VSRKDGSIGFKPGMVLASGQCLGMSAIRGDMPAPEIILPSPRGALAGGWPMVQYAARRSWDSVMYAPPSLEHDGWHCQSSFHPHNQRGACSSHGLRLHPATEVVSAEPLAQEAQATWEAWSAQAARPPPLLSIAVLDTQSTGSVNAASTTYGFDGYLLLLDRPHPPRRAAVSCQLMYLERYSAHMRSG